MRPVDTHWWRIKFSGICLVVYTLIYKIIYIYRWIYTHLQICLVVYSMDIYIERERDLNPLKPCLGTGEFFNFLSWQILQILEAEIRPVYCHNCQQLSRAEVLPDFFAVFGHHMTSYDMIHHTTTNSQKCLNRWQQVYPSQYANCFALCLHVAASQHQSPDTFFKTNISRFSAWLIYFPRAIVVVELWQFEVSRTHQAHGGPMSAQLQAAWDHTSGMRSIVIPYNIIQSVVDYYSNYIYVIYESKATP
jgi:hypothetical protein